MRFDKTPIARAFRMLRTFGILAEQNYLCCQSCGQHAMNEQHKAAPKDAKPLGYVFYHGQDYDFMKEDGKLMLAYNAFGDGDSAAIGRLIVHCLSQCGLRPKWSGDVRTRIGVQLKAREVGDAKAK